MIAWLCKKFIKNRVNKALRQIKDFEAKLEKIDLWYMRIKKIMQLLEILRQKLDDGILEDKELDEIQEAYDDDEDFNEEYYTSDRCPSCGRKISRHEEELYDGECVDCFTRKHGR